MKIATWNVERLKHCASLDKLLQACERVRADILVLTETDTKEDSANRMQHYIENL